MKINYLSRKNAIKIICWFSTCTVDSWDSFYMFSYDDEKTDLWQQYSLNTSILTTQFKEVGDKKVFFIFCSVTTYFFRCYSVFNSCGQHFLWTFYSFTVKYISKFLQCEGSFTAQQAALFWSRSIGSADRQDSLCSTVQKDEKGFPLSGLQKI